MIEVLENIARDAAKEICTVYEAGAETDAIKKDDGSPLTEADMRSHRSIMAGLTKAFPDIPILSEENAADLHRGWKEWERFFLVDPLDGTKEFLKRNGEFTVNIALIDEGIPVAGVVHVPIGGTSYVAERGRGAFRIADGATTSLRVAEPEAQRLRVVGSRSHASPELDRFLQSLDYPELISKGSSLKLCLIADGSADYYPRHGPTSWWDIAAGHCVITEAGGFVIDRESVELRYGGSDSVLNPPFIAGAGQSKWIAGVFSASLR